MDGFKVPTKSPEMYVKSLMCMFFSGKKFQYFHQTCLKLVYDLPNVESLCWRKATLTLILTGGHLPTPSLT